jgi:hypothetical protein
MTPGKIGHLFLPKILVDKESVISEAGEIKIKEALEALEKGEVKDFDNVDEFIDELNS